MKKPRDCVILLGYNEEGRAIYNHTFCTYDWYENLHPIIDDDEETVRLGIRRMDGWQYTRHGQLEKWWRLAYGEDGSTVEHREWRKDGTVWEWRDDAFHQIEAPAAVNADSNEQEDPDSKQLRFDF